MLADYHVHTSYSDDSEYTMENVVKDAISLGLEEICFTDHVDYGFKRDWDDPRGMTLHRPLTFYVCIVTLVGGLLRLEAIAIERNIWEHILWKQLVP